MNRFTLMTATAILAGSVTLHAFDTGAITDKASAISFITSNACAIKDPSKGPMDFNLKNTFESNSTPTKDPKTAKNTVFLHKTGDTLFHVIARLPEVNEKIPASVFTKEIANKQNSFGWTPFLLAIRYNPIRAIGMLDVADFSVLTKNKWNALHVAVKHGQLDFLKALKTKLNSEQSTSNGIFSNFKKQPSAFESLLAKSKTRTNLTPHFLATKYKHQAVLDFLNGKEETITPLVEE